MILKSSNDVNAL